MKKKFVVSTFLAYVTISTGMIPEQELQTPLLENSAFNAQPIISKIREYKVTSLGSLNSYLFPLGLGAINFASLYICKAFHKAERGGDDPFLDKLTILSLGAGGLLLTAPLCKCLYYTGKKWYHYSKITRLVRQTFSQDETNGIISIIEHNPSKALKKLELTESEGKYLSDLKKFLKVNPQQPDPLENV